MVTSSDGLGLACIFVCQMTDLLTCSQLFLHGSGPSQSSHDVRKSEETQTIRIAFLSTPERRPKSLTLSPCPVYPSWTLICGSLLLSEGVKVKRQSRVAYMPTRCLFHHLLPVARMREELLEVLSSKHSHNWFALSRW